MAMLAAVAAVAGMSSLFSQAPAQAGVHAVAAGLGNATLSTTLFYPVNSTNASAPLSISPKSATFTFHFSTGATVAVPGGTVSGGISATGSVHGWCGLSVGSGTVSGGGPFSWIGIGGTLIVTGQVNGAVNAAPNALLGDSCATVGANDFIVNGGGIATSCATVNSSVTVSTPTGSIGNLVHVHSSIHGKGHACA
jgi:hypothetical protein